MVEGMTIEAKSHVSATRNEAGHPKARSERNLILAAMKNTLKIETTSAIPKPGSLFKEMRSSVPGSYVNHTTAAMVNRLMLNDNRA